MDSYEQSLEIEFRKQEGIFYSPNYVTQYIVNEAFNFLESVNFEEIQQLKILDPSCGTGVFLEESFDFLLTFYQQKFPNFQNPAKWIIENNLYGVDLDKKAVHICQKRLFEKSGVWCENIKMGNSLIDDPEVDPKAFDWKKQFPKTVEGFDLILGNPPYVSTKIIHEKWKKYLLEKYETAKGQFDLYGLFIERSQKMLKLGGKFGYITSSTFLSNKDFAELRRFLFEKTKIEQIVYLGETVFDEAAVDVSILIFLNEKADENHKIKVIKSRKDFDEKPKIFHEVRQSRFDLEKNNYEIKLNSEEHDFDLIDKIYENTEFLANILDLPRGIEMGGNSEKISHKFEKGFEKILVGKNIAPYRTMFDQMYIQFENDKSVFKTLDIYKQPKILIQRIRNLTLKQRIVATLDRDGFLCTNTLRIGLLKNENYDLVFILGILNSQVVNFIFSKFFLNKDIYAYQLERIPVPKISLAQQKEIADKVEQLLVLNQNLHTTQNQFLDLLETNYDLLKTSKKLQKWYELDKKTLLKELEKQKTEIPLKKQVEFFSFFENEQKTALNFANQIQILENQLDQMVFDLYGLSAEEREMMGKG